ncbi:2-oxoglutarate dehydrogenase complex dihydrolipoyllysine-residue succinyltransferase [Kangiella koreensis]|uniref:Dihydrolipoyllysine-residue succinyltransferase component of 2-oxoglutarate dehydrogenase complex n=1 Tax=Kangiella koreensis (strain DSM 16069 / JCM 12317 / KCTC 12182 / SW-125) TaxID=523791 RepID=C7RCG0_KANKD|nr:2-oxoglutarate dehydrogenase complex dihydrolipoyllysine-residue succinyltransferase [Kangiella koreensis]ACV26952.1 2-oxoglutarate dehydrogenase, E2 subunit, dihydrolipoamide succinyltransferase [Kangiella koreensis DSM 16069]
MAIEIKVPVLPESVADATIATWHVKPGESVSRDQNLVDIETDKVVLEVVAPDDGVISEIIKEEGDTVLQEEAIAKFEAGASGDAKADSSDEKKDDSSKESKKDDKEEAKSDKEEASSADLDVLSPAVRRLVAEHNLDPKQIPASGKGGRLTKEDVEKFIKDGGASAKSSESKKDSGSAPVSAGLREEKRVPMTRLRKRIAERLVEAQQTAAILTTFNDINMKEVVELRSRYKEQFEKVHGTRLGFMSFFVKATVEALKRYPAVNASIDGDDIVYHGFYDIGVAVSSPRGLVVPVLRDADTLSLAEIEAKIREFGVKARDNKLTVEDMTGGTFTISNGGVFGSLMATPIINPPQSAILGMNRMEDRPVVINGEIVIRPMMNVALSYDHRIIDGRESVGFLKTIKEFIEDPARMLLDL